MTALPVPLPPGFSPKVHSHDSVTVGMVIAQKTARVEEVVNVAGELQIPLSQVKKVLKKNPGDMVAVGDIVALKKSWFGLKKRAIVSTIDGIVLRYERGTGNLFVRTGGLGESKEIVSPVDGVVSLCDNKQIVIKTDKNVLVGKRGYGESGDGEVFVLTASFDRSDPDGTNSLYHLDSQAMGKVVIGKVFSREILIKGLGVGAKGFIGLHFADDDVEYLAKRSMSMPLIEVDESQLQRLVQWKGKRLFLEPQSNSIIMLRS
ncbi:MAG: hypothetical protein AAB553_03325 [Patescibacteria group bacterium]